MIPRGAGVTARGATVDAEGNQILPPDAALLTPRGSADFNPARAGRAAIRPGQEPAPLPPSRLPRLTPRIAPPPGRPPVQQPEVLSLGEAPPTGEEPVPLGTTTQDALQAGITGLLEATQDPGTGVVRIRYGAGRSAGSMAGLPTQSFEARGLAPGTRRLAGGELEVIDGEGNGLIIQPAFEEQDEAVGEIAALGGEDIEIDETGGVSARFGRFRVVGRPQINVEEAEEGEPTEGPGISITGEGSDQYATFRYSNGRLQGFTPRPANPPGLTRLINGVIGGTAPQATNPAGSVLVRLGTRLLGLQPSFLVQDAPPDAVEGVQVVDEDTVLVTYAAEEVAAGEEPALIVQEFTILEDAEVAVIAGDEAVAAELGIEVVTEEEVTEETPELGIEVVVAEEVTEETPTAETTTTGEPTTTTTEGTSAAPTTTETTTTTTTGETGGTSSTETTTTTTGETSGTETATTTETTTGTTTTTTTTGETGTSATATGGTGTTTTTEGSTSTSTSGTTGAGSTSETTTITGSTTGTTT